MVAMKGVLRVVSADKVMWEIALEIASHKHIVQLVSIKPIFPFVKQQTSCSKLKLFRLECNQNEVFKKCGASCQATCDNRYPANCNYDCKDGCACVDGYVRDKSGYCIPSSQCPSKGKRKTF